MSILPPHPLSLSTAEFNSRPANSRPGLFGMEAVLFLRLAVIPASASQCPRTLRLPSLKSRKEYRVIRISVVLTRGPARYRVAVKAQSIRRALEIVEGNYPGRQADMVSPVDPGASFVRDASAIDGLVDREAA